ncbi:MAG: DUF3253 domain-containing protein [Pseudomonadota bacterium]
MAEDRAVPIVSDDEIASAILELCEKRGCAKTICPSDAARALRPDGDVWRGLMPDVRRVAGTLVQDGRIEATQRGSVVDPVEARGPIRLGLKR